MPTVREHLSAHGFNCIEKHIQKRLLVRKRYGMGNYE